MFSNLIVTVFKELSSLYKAAFNPSFSYCEDALSKKTVSIHQLVSFMTKKINALPEEGSEMHQLQVITAEGILNNLNMRLDNTLISSQIAEISLGGIHRSNS
mgnify:CR=1 FL=1